MGKVITLLATLYTPVSFVSRNSSYIVEHLTFKRETSIKDLPHLLPNVRAYTLILGPARHTCSIAPA